MREQKTITAEISHDLLIAKMQPRLRYDPTCDYDEWKKAIREKFIELTGLDEIEKNACPLNVQIEWEEQKEGYKLVRFTFESEVGEIVPCYLLVPDTGKEKYPVAITLHGHSTGFHTCIGETKYEGDEKNLPRVALALQAVRNGFAALAIEQRGMGERRSPRSYGKNNEYYPRPHACAFPSLTAITLGRTILAERVWDVSKAIDAITAHFPVCDMDKILITGNSGGGTASYYAACFDERIKLSVPSCSFSPYKTSILDIEHCACNYIPFAYKYFDMQDLACMIAPRELVVVTGQKDDIFPIEGVRRGFETVRKIYAASGVDHKCRLIETPMHHWWCVDIVWNAINEECQKLGWK